MNLTPQITGTTKVSTINFGKNNAEPPKETEANEKPTGTHINLKIPTLAMLMYLNVFATEPPKQDMELAYCNPIETVAETVAEPVVTTITPKEQTLPPITNWNPTQLNSDELTNAPSPKITIKGQKKLAGIVVDVTENKLYRYDSNGNVIDGYLVATGVIGRNGKSITGTGIRMVDHIETYPYRSAVGTKRKRNPSAYGPKILYLTVVNPKTGEIMGSNGEFIHGNNKPSSIGKHASHGCVRMDNEVIKKLAEETKLGTYVLIK